VRLLPFAEAGAHSEVVLNATAGAQSLTALQEVGAANLAGKVLVDLAVPLEYVPDMPPKLYLAGGDSLGEQIQRSFPAARVVKALNTMQFKVMLDPARLPARHNVFLAGEDAAAKDTVTRLLEELGWPLEDITDLGGIEGARATEMATPLLFRLAGVLGTYEFNFAVVRR
jgi:predicted dinucleotide-binding enzyme